VNGAMPVVLLALAGFLLGGAYSLRKQDRPVRVVVTVAAAGALCLVAGVLYL